MQPLASQTASGGLLLCEVAAALVAEALNRRVDMCDS